MCRAGTSSTHPASSGSGKVKQSLKCSPLTRSNSVFPCSALFPLRYSRDWLLWTFRKSLILVHSHPFLRCESEIARLSFLTERRQKVSKSHLCAWETSDCLYEETYTRVFSGLLRQPSKYFLYSGRKVSRCRGLSGNSSNSASYPPEAYLLSSCIPYSLISATGTARRHSCH